MPTCLLAYLFIYLFTCLPTCLLAYLCYGPSVISVTVTKGGYLRAGGLYKISGTIRRGVAELRKQFSMYIKSEYRNVTYLKC